MGAPTFSHTVPKRVPGLYIDDEEESFSYWDLQLEQRQFTMSVITALLGAYCVTTVKRG